MRKKTATVDAPSTAHWMTAMLNRVNYALTSPDLCQAIQSIAPNERAKLIEAAAELQRLMQPIAQQASEHAAREMVTDGVQRPKCGCRHDGDYEE